jgi:peptidylprolyl isomerase domain and WD repeat-containing protein 1
MQDIYFPSYFECSFATRTCISGAPPECQPILQELHAQGYPQLLRYYKVRIFNDMQHIQANRFSSRTDFLITTSIDGHLKFWKKQEEGIEFVKHYRVHLSPIVSVSASTDGQLFATVSEDGTAKIFDVVNFGMYFALYHYSH